MKNKVTLIWPFNMHAQKIPELFPIGLGYLIDNIDAQRFDVNLLDCAIQDFHPESQEFKNELVRLSPNVVGISWWSNNTPIVELTISVIKQVLPDVTIIVGGPHPSAYGEQLIRHHNIDFVFYGEAEIGFPKLLDFFLGSPDGPISSEFLSVVEGLIYLDDEGEVHKTSQSLENDLDRLGAIEYGRLGLTQYQEKGYSYGGKAVRTDQLTAPMVATRGCPYKCNFCAAPAMNGRKVRKHSIPYLLKHITTLYEKYHVRHIAFVDDMFTLDIQWAQAVCEGIEGLNLQDFTVSTPNGIRLERMNLDLAKSMKRAGWKELVIAPESGSPRTLKEMEKGLHLEKVKPVIELLHEAELKVAAFFIIGYPNETMDDLLLTEQFIYDHDFDDLCLHIFQPLPGTPIFDRLVQQGEITSTFVPGSYQQVTFKPKFLEKDQVRDVYNRILNTFRDSKGWKYKDAHVASVRQPDQLYGAEMAHSA